MSNQLQNLNNQTDCPICLETLSQESNEANTSRQKTELICNHIFHADCIGRWLESHNTCPMCRRQVNHPAQRDPRVAMALRDIIAPRTVSVPLRHSQEHTYTTRAAPAPVSSSERLIVAQGITVDPNGRTMFTALNREGQIVQSREIPAIRNYSPPPRTNSSHNKNSITNTALTILTLPIVLLAFTFLSIIERLKNRNLNSQYITVT